MKELCQQLYESLQKDIHACQEKYPCLLKQIEHSFQLCNQYWAIVRDDVTRYDFETKEEEIFFFKHLKPLFMSQVEYYSLCYHAQLFKNEVYDPVKISQFWNREALRLDKFIAEHRDFYEYYKNGSADKDQLFFTRTNNNPDHSSDPDTKAKTLTSHDPMGFIVACFGEIQ